MKGGIMVFRLNAEKSVIEWHGVNKIVPYKGNLKIKRGTIVEELNNVVEGKLTFDMRSIQVKNEFLSEEENQELTEKWKSKDYFDVEKFPEASFTTREIIDRTEHKDLKGVLKFKGYAFGFALPVKVDKYNDQIILEGHIKFKDINPAVRHFMGNTEYDKLPNIEVGYKIYAERVKEEV